MNTKEIVSFIAKLSKEIEFKEFNEWEQDFREIEKSFELPEDIKHNFPLKKEVIKLVYKEIFNIMPFSKEYILKNYEKKECDISYLFFPAKAKKLIILFSGLSEHKTYNRYSWYWDDKEKWNGDTAYLFFNDLSKSWYVGTEEKPLKEVYKNIIKKHIKDLQLSNQDVFCVGGSMGGYASILFSFELGLGGCLSIHPQLNYQSTLRQKAGDWATNIRKCGSKFINAEDLIYLVEKKPKIYLEFGNYEADRYCADTFVNELKKHDCFLILNKHKNEEHVTISPSKERIDSVISFFQSNV